MKAKAILLAASLLFVGAALADSYTHKTPCGRYVITIEKADYPGDDWEDYLEVLDDMMCGENPIPPGQ